MFINLTKTEVEETVTALEETKWIPCSEKMPEDNTDVIVCFYSGTVTEMSDTESRNNYCGECGCKFDWSEIDEAD